MRSYRRAAAALATVVSIIATAGPAAGVAVPQKKTWLPHPAAHPEYVVYTHAHEHRRRRRTAIQIAAKPHHWGAAQQADWRQVIHCESDGGCADHSAVIHWHLTITNGSCYGIAQFIGGAEEYFAYGGSPYTVIGQLTAMGNYIAGRYGTPSRALYYELHYHYY